MHHGAECFATARAHTTDDKKLGDDRFLSKAPAEVVEEQRRRRKEAEQTQAKLTEALERLAAVG